MRQEGSGEQTIIAHGPDKLARIGGEVLRIDVEGLGKMVRRFEADGDQFPWPHGRHPAETVQEHGLRLGLRQSEYADGGGLIALAAALMKGRQATIGQNEIGIQKYDRSRAVPLHRFIEMAHAFPLKGVFVFGECNAVGVGEWRGAAHLDVFQYMDAAPAKGVQPGAARLQHRPGFRIGVDMEIYFGVRRQGRHVALHHQERQRHFQMRRRERLTPDQNEDMILHADTSHSSAGRARARTSRQNAAAV